MRCAVTLCVRVTHTLLRDGLRGGKPCVPSGPWCVPSWPPRRTPRASVCSPRTLSSALFLLALNMYWLVSVHYTTVVCRYIRDLDDATLQAELFPLRGLVSMTNSTAGCRSAAAPAPLTSDMWKNSRPRRHLQREEPELRTATDRREIHTYILVLLHWHCFMYVTPEEAHYTRLVLPLASRQQNSCCTSDNEGNNEGRATTSTPYQVEYRSP